MNTKILSKLADEYIKLAHQSPQLPLPPLTSIHDYYGQGNQWHQQSMYGTYNAVATHQSDAEGKPFNYNQSDEVVGWHRHPFGDWYSEPSEDPRE